MNGQAVSVEDCLTLEYGTDRLSRNFSNYQCKPHNIPEERVSNLRRGGSLKSHPTKLRDVGPCDLLCGVIGPV